MCRGRKIFAAAIALLAVLVSIGAASASSSPRAHQAYGCGDPFGGTRDRSNPLMLPSAPGSNPLTGAKFFVDGPRHGSAAGAIAKLLGIDPTRYPDNYSWARFRASLDTGSLHRRFAHDRRLRWKVHMLEKIADQPETQRFSAYSQGGGPGKIYSQVVKIFCYNMTADPGTIPIINTLFLHPDLGHCPTRGGIAAAAPTFKRQINEMAVATGRRPAVFLLELDGIGSSHCMVVMHDLPQYLALFRYEVNKIAALPHTVVYAEAGYSDANPIRYTARALRAIGVNKIRGFYTNDTHLNWTTHEVKWAERISKLTGGAHFTVNTAQNGRGPKKNRHPVTQGNEDLCNPPGRGLGPTDTTHTGFRYADAFLWTHVPGNSSGCGGGPPGGVFWPARAISLASKANDKLGPGYPSRPY